MLILGFFSLNNFKKLGKLRKYIDFGKNLNILCNSIYSDNFLLYTYLYD